MTMCWLLPLQSFLNRTLCTGFTIRFRWNLSSVHAFGLLKCPNSRSHSSSVGCNQTLSHQCFDRLPPSKSNAGSSALHIHIAVMSTTQVRRLVLPVTQLIEIHDTLVSERSYSSHISQRVPSGNVRNSGTGSRDSRVSNRTDPHLHYAYLSVVNIE